VSKWDYDRHEILADGIVHALGGSLWARGRDRPACPRRVGAHGS
jgi:hypothetical protein